MAINRFEYYKLYQNQSVDIKSYLFGIKKKQIKLNIQVI